MRKGKNEPGDSGLGERIKTIIREKSILQKEFAASLGVSANYIYLITSGKKDSISETLALLIEKIYGYCAHWILTGEENKLVPHQKNLKQDTIKRIRMMYEAELKAVAAFIRSFEEIEG